MHRRIHKGRAANDQAIDRRDLARIRRSEHRKSIKENAFNRNRDLVAVIDEQIAGPSGSGQPVVQDGKGRKAALQRWKEQKALRLRLQKEAERVKPPFKLPGKIVYKNPSFLSEQLPPPTKVQPSKRTEHPDYGIVTRSRAAAAPISAKKELFAVPTKRVMKAKRKSMKAKRRTGEGQSASENPKRNVSFAPENHIFIPPIIVTENPVATISNYTAPQDTGTFSFVADNITPMETEEPVKTTLETITSVPCTPELDCVPRVATPLQDVLNSQNVTLTRGSGSRRKRERKSLVLADADVPKTLNFDEGTVNNAVVQDTAAISDQAVEVSQPPLSPEYFHELVKSTTQTLRNFTSKWNQFKDSNENIPEDAIGMIMTTVGLTDILIKSKFKQFTGLVNDCQNGSEQLVTVTDLQGFWDMVQYQVDDVQKKFYALEKHRENNWVMCEEVEVQNRKVVRKKKVQATTGTRHASDARKRIAEMRAKARALQNTVTPRRSSVRLKRKSSTAPTPKEMPTPVVAAAAIFPFIDSMDEKSHDTQKPKDETPMSKDLTELFSPLDTPGVRSLRSRSTNLIRFSDANLPASSQNPTPLATLDED